MITNLALQTLPQTSSPRSTSAHKTSASDTWSSASKKTTRRSLKKRTTWETTSMGCENRSKPTSRISMTTSQQISALRRSLPLWRISCSENRVLWAQIRSCLQLPCQSETLKASIVRTHGKTATRSKSSNTILYVSRSSSVGRSSPLSYTTGNLWS